MFSRIAALTILSIGSASAERVNSDVTVHEWGTFTSVAGEDGGAVQWAPFSGPSDLPCFVYNYGPWIVKSVPGLIRMETPVLYFYAQQAAMLAVNVRFPSGWISEWYPRARVLPEREPVYRSIGPGGGQIEWQSVNVLPGKDLLYPTGNVASHYYAARQTDSASVRVGDQQEKFLFYRGVANFIPPVRARFTADDEVEIRNTSSDAIPLAVLFENRAGKVAHRLARDVNGTIRLSTPELQANPADIRRKIAEALVQAGLYEKEAAAMIETWKDSWFDEEGTRVFYLVPRPMVDRVLPLRITPEPASIERVFVGRVELLSPWMERSVESALLEGDIATITRAGRFLSPFMDQIRRKNARIANSMGAQTSFYRAQENLRRKFDSISCVQ